MIELSDKFLNEECIPGTSEPSELTLEPPAKKTKTSEAQ